MDARVYQVFLPGGAAAVEEHYPRRYALLDDSLWVIAADEATPADVCQRLGIGPERSGVVTGLEVYYGFYDAALWQKIDAWSME